MNFGPTNYPGYFLTAYGLWLKLGNQGTEQDFLDSLKGEGLPGKSAYAYAQEAGFQGSEADFALKLARDGKSAYEYAVEGGYTGSEAEFTASLGRVHIDELNGVRPGPDGRATLTPGNIGAQPAGSYATKRELGEKLDLTGGTVTGDLTVQGAARVPDPAEADQAVNLRTLRKTQTLRRVVLTRIGWGVKNLQTVEIPEATDTCYPLILPTGSTLGQVPGHNADLFYKAGIHYVGRKKGSITVGCVNEPAENIPVDVLILEPARPE